MQFQIVNGVQGEEAEGGVGSSSHNKGAKLSRQDEVHNELVKLMNPDVWSYSLGR